jgi:hypothetical protein
LAGLKAKAEADPGWITNKRTGKGKAFDFVNCPHFVALRSAGLWRRLEEQAYAVEGV